MAKKNKIMRSDKPLTLVQWERVVLDVLDGFVTSASIDGVECADMIGAAYQASARAMDQFRAAAKKREAVRK